VDAALLDTIYESVLHPELWDDVLLGMAEGVGAEGGALVWQDIFTNAAGGVFARTDPEAIDLFSGYFATRNPLRPRAAEVREAVKSWTPRIILDENRMAKSDFVKTEFYNDFFRRFDFHSSAAVGLEVDGRNAGTLDLLKSRRAGEFSKADLDFLREAQPHLCRAFKAGRRVASAKGGLGSSAANAFDDWTCGVLVLSGECRVLYSNAAAESFVTTGSAIRIINGVLHAVDAHAAPRLEALVRLAADRDEERRSGGYLAAPSARDRLPLSLSITPLRGERHPLFSQAAVFVTVIDPARDLALSPQKLREVFGLTATEVKVAIGLFGGQPTGDVADQLGISVNTVRNHLAHILEKTHSSGQAELSRRLMTLA
jgi:DNA-binding CsgD family transcriptional regulator